MTDRLITAADLIRHMRSRFAYETHEQISDALGLSAGFIGMLLKGTRAPSKAILEKLGYERVIRYRRARPVRRRS